MKLFLLTLLVVGVFAKTKDDAILGSGEIAKLRLQQRFSTYNVDITNRHFLDQILVNVNRCLHDCKDDYKLSKDVDQYNACVGNLVDFTLGRINFLDRNNLLDNAETLTNLANRVKLCNIGPRGTDFWNTDNTGMNLLDVNRDLGGYGVGDRDITQDWIVNRGYNQQYDSTVNRFYRDTSGRKVDRGDTAVHDSTYGSTLDHGDTYGRGNVYGGKSARGDIYGRENVYGSRLDRGDIYGRGQVSGGADIYGRDMYGRGVGGVGCGVGGVRCSDWNTGRRVGYYQGSTPTGWYRIIYGLIGNNQDFDYGRSYGSVGNYDSVRNYDNVGDNFRFSKDIGFNRNDIYGRFGADKRIGVNVDYGTDVDRDVSVRKNFNVNKFTGERDIYGRRTDYDSYNTVGGHRFDNYLY